MMVLVVLVGVLKNQLFPLPLAEVAELGIALVKKLLGGEF
jgi:hypothetical protein